MMSRMRMKKIRTTKKVVKNLIQERSLVINHNLPRKQQRINQKPRRQKPKRRVENKGKGGPQRLKQKLKMTRHNKKSRRMKMKVKMIGLN